jgi:hypothetical protein
LSEILAWLQANETVMSAIAAGVVVLSIVGAAMRGALKGTARVTKDVLSHGQVPTVDVSQPVPGFGGRPAIAVLPLTI